MNPDDHHHTRDDDTRDAQTAPRSPASSLLKGLTDVQAQAVQHVDGPLLVLAGPGSGKTRVITHRIGHLILEVGIPPWNILAITFTNKAAREMRDRCAAFLSPRQARAATITTFHSLCARILREFADALDLPSSYSIYDTADQKRAVKQVCENLEINSKNFPPARVLAMISNAKNELVDADGFAAMASDFYSRQVARIFKGYQALLARNKALDFDDLLLRTAHLLRTQPAVAEALTERYQYILIDEYQDTNHAQFVIANALAASHHNICATGDPDQSIYRWRGADIRNILEFERHYPDAAVIRLEQNYRSTGRILAAADRLIQNNTQRKAKALWTENDEGQPVTIATHADEKAEAAWVVEQFRQLHLEHGLPWSEMAIFYRTNSLSRVLEEACRDTATPYQIARGTAFYDRKEVKDAVAYLRAVANPDDEVNLLRIINTPARGISDKTVKALQAKAAADHTSLLHAMRNAHDAPSLNVRAVRSVARFVELFDKWVAACDQPIESDDNSTQDSADAPSYEDGFRDGYAAAVQDGAFESEDDINCRLRNFVEKLLHDSTLQSHYAKDASDPDGERVANLGELLSGAQQYELEYLAEFGEDAPLRARLEGFLERIALISDLDGVSNDQGAVTLMTLHAAKGLEYDAVAIIGVEEALLPHSQSMGDPANIEEERRLCFVGITRARKHLWLNHTTARAMFGRRERNIASRFLDELRASEHVQHLDLAQDALDDFLNPDDRGPDPDSADAGWQWGRGGNIAREQHASAGSLSPGTLVRHQHFGVGKILLVVGGRARVQFQRVGVKTLILEHARLQRV